MKCMNKLTGITAVLTLATVLFAGNALAVKVAGIELAPTMMVGEQELTYNGAGIRKKLFIKLYVGSLYAAQNSNDAAALVSADEAMAIRINVISDFLTRKKMIKALNEGFSRSTGGNTAPIQAGIDQLIGLMKDSIKTGNSLTLAYEPGAGTHVMRDGEALSVVPGLAFKQALFGIWLSDSPAQASLKKAMLGK